MIKKTLTTVGIAGLLIFGASTAANAASYPPVVDGTSSSPVVAPGVPTTISFGFPGYDDGTTVTFVVTGEDVSGVTLATIVRTAVTSKSFDKTITGGSASVQFSSTTGGTFTVTPFIDGRQVGNAVSVTVDASGGGSDASPALPATGSEVPAAALWLGVGAVGIGGIAIAAGVARRRAHNAN